MFFERIVQKKMISSDWQMVYPQWGYVFPLPNTSNLTLRGYSRGGERTGFFISELKTFIDGGVRSNLIGDRILVTHCHSDHCMALPMLMTGMPKGHKVDIIVPQENEKGFEEYLKSAYYLFRNKFGDFDQRAIVRGWSPNMELKISKGNSIFIMKSYKLDHSVPTLGYGIFEMRKKIKAEHVGKSPKELVELRKQHQIIDEELAFPQVVFVFDSSIKVFFENPELLTFPNIVVECTFLKPEDQELAEESKHIHWDHLKSFVESNPNVLFILTHFSMRYTMAEIYSFFHVCPFSNVKVWTNSSEK